MANGYLVGPVEDIAEDTAKLIPAADLGTNDDIAVFNDGGTLYALDDTCTHEDASLAEGWIEPGEVECPLHAARFSLTTGKALCLPATEGVCPHRVEVVDGQVWLYPGEAPTQ